jgi:glycosyltransferase involved in cell wall biosynthesis
MKPPVLMIAYACNPEGGGEHWLGWGWAEQAAKNHSVHLITTPNARAQVEKHAPRHGITPHFVEQPQAGRWGRKIGWQSRVLKVASELHAREKFQIVHQTTFHTFRVPFLAAGLGIPSVWGPVAGGESVPPGFGEDLGNARFEEMGRRLANRVWLWHPQIRKSLRQVGAIFVSNRTTRNFLPASVHSKCVIVPPNALRAEDEQYPAPQLRPETEAFHLLYVGNCVATRALPLVFAALRQIKTSGIKLRVVGAGPALERWKGIAADLVQAGVVEFTGQVTREQLPAIYGRAHALVFPALRDSGGSALLEAMARGVPVICLDWGGPGEMVDEHSGWKIPVRDRNETVAGLGAAITQLRAAPEKRLALAVAARERALKLFRWEARAELLENTYRRLLAGA